MSLHDLLNKLEAAEQDFLHSEVLAPVLPGQVVGVRIAGVLCHLRLDDAQFQGWAILRPLSTERAEVVRPAKMAEVKKYLQLLPSVRLLTVVRAKQIWYALPAQKGDSRIKIEQPVPVLLPAEGLQPFDAIIARFDGRRFWYEQNDARRNPALGAYLRESFNSAIEPAKLHKKGLSVEEREAYSWAWFSLEDARRNRDEVRLANALAHAEGRLLSFIERSDVYTVTYQVNERVHTSTVRKDDLSVLTSGICLSGRDRDFDITSLVGVMREAVNQW